MAVEEDDGQGGKRRTNRARRERKGTPQGAPISPLLSNIYMRRFMLGWKTLGHVRRFGAEIANYADDFVVCGRAPAEAMRAAVEWMMERLRLPVNARKTRWLRVPENRWSLSGTAWDATANRITSCVTGRWVREQRAAARTSMAKGYQRLRMEERVRVGTSATSPHGTVRVQPGPPLRTFRCGIA